MNNRTPTPDAIEQNGGSVQQLTPDQVRQLSGWELDAAVAEALFPDRLRWTCYGEGTPHATGTPRISLGDFGTREECHQACDRINATDKRMVEVWGQVWPKPYSLVDFSSDGNAMLALIEAMHGRGNPLLLEYQTGIMEDLDEFGWVAEFRRGGGKWAVAETAPLAVARAALIAVMEADSE